MKALPKSEPRQSRPRLGLSVLALSVSAVLAAQAHANPVGARVAHGHAGFSGGPGQLEISNTPGAIINWQGFSIGRDEVTRFIQQHVDSAVLNRVTGGMPSEILGSLLSNGRVFLINQNGIVFGEHAIVDTAGLVASSLNISDADFLAGRLQFTGNGGPVENRGYIRVGHGGEVALIAPDVTNSGIIHADDGHVLLAAGRDVLIESLDYEHVRFRVQAPSDRVLNLGRVIAANGVVSLFAGTLEHRGLIEANRVSRDADGVVRLEASGDVEVTGRVTAMGIGARGGDVTITGRGVELRGADVDVSGDLGGGRARIGGDYQGRGDLARADRTSLDEASTVRADARHRGDGGEIIVWSEQATETFAQLSARGGPSGGDGGLIETSSRGSLTFGRPADAAAPAGRPGTWLLDPEDILIGDGEAASISDALNQGSNVSVKTADSGDGEGNITVASPIAKTEGDDAALSMQAHNRIDVNASITSTSGKLDVSLKAGKAVHVNANVDTNGGRFSQVITEMALAMEVEDLEDEADGSDDIAVPGDDGPEDDVAQSEDVSDEDMATAGEALDTNDEAAQPESEVASLSDEEVPGGDSTEGEDIVDASDESDSTSATVGSDAFKYDMEVLVDADVVTHGGDIFVDAGREGVAGVYSRLDSSSESGKGGDITVLGENVGLFEEAVVDASGESGGGQVLIGGDQQGKNPEVPNASSVYTGSDTTVRADATGSGDGGRVIVYAEDSARVYGRLSARGGRLGGDGGFIETSGRRSFDIRTSPDVSAPNGEGGTWLIDPTTVTIVTSVDDGIDGIGSEGDPFRPTDGNDNTIAYTTVLDALMAGDGGNTVRIVTECSPASPCGDGDGDIVIEYFVYEILEEEDFDKLLDSTLVLDAARDIRFESDLRDDGEIYGGRFNLHVISDSPDGKTIIDDGESSGPFVVVVNDFTADSDVVIRNGGSLVVWGDAEFRRSLQVVSEGGGVDDTELEVYGAAQFDGPVDIEVLDDLGYSSYISLSGGQAVFDGDVTLTNDDAGGDTDVYLDVYNGPGDIDAMFNADVELNEGTFIRLFENTVAEFNDTFHGKGGTLAEVGFGVGMTFYIRPGATATLESEDSVLFLDPVALILDNARLVNQGTVNWISGDIIGGDDYGGTIVNEGIWNKFEMDFAMGGDVSIDQFVRFVNQGEFNVDDGRVDFNSGNFEQTAGSLNLINNGEVGDERDGVLGTMYFSGGSITGTGTVDANVCVGVLEEGCDTTGAQVTIAPGDSLGTLNFSGNLPLTAGSRLEFELGAPPGALIDPVSLSHLDTGADAINVGGDFGLNGATVAISLIDGHTPALGDVYTLMYVANGDIAEAARVDGVLKASTFELPEGLAVIPSAEHIASYVINITVDDLVFPPPPAAPPAPNPIPPAAPGNGPTPVPPPPGLTPPGLTPPTADPIIDVVSTVDNNPPSGLFDPVDEEERRRQIGMCTG